MTSIFVLLVSFLGIGLFTHTYSRRARVLISGGIIVLLIYLYLT